MSLPLADLKKIVMPNNHHIRAAEKNTSRIGEIIKFFGIIILAKKL